MSETGSTRADRGDDEELDDPGRDPEGLSPPRDFLDTAGSVPENGSFQPHRATQPRDNPPDEPPTSTGTEGP
jgi:hypothetical protein